MNGHSSGYLTVVAVPFIGIFSQYFTKTPFEFSRRSRFFFILAMDEVRLSPFSKSPDSCQREPTDTAVARGNLPSDEVTPVNDRLYGENMVDSTSDVRYSCERAEEINRSMEELCCSIVDSTSEDMGIAQIPDSSGLSSGDTGRNGDLCDLPATKKVGKFRFLGGTSERGDVENDTNGYSEEGLTPKSDGAVVSHSDVNDQEEPATKIRRSSRIRTLEEERKRLKSRQIPCLDFMVECSFTGDGTIDSHLTGSEGGDRISDRTVGVSQQILDICDMSGIRTQQKLDSRSPGEPLGPDTQSAAPTSSVPSECGLKLKSRWLKTAEIQSVGENVVSVSDVPPSARALTTEFVTISENQFISER